MIAAAICEQMLQYMDVDLQKLQSYMIDKKSVRPANMPENTWSIVCTHVKCIQCRKWNEKWIAEEVIDIKAAQLFNQNCKDYHVIQL